MLTALAKIILRVLATLSPLILIRLVLPLPDYLRGAIDVILIGAVVVVILAALSFTFLSLFRSS
jgi:hypothetical protein